MGHKCSSLEALTRRACCLSEARDREAARVARLGEVVVATAPVKVRSIFHKGLIGESGAHSVKTELEERTLVLAWEPVAEDLVEVISCGDMLSEYEEVSVWLNVYDLEKLTSFTNVCLRPFHLGVFHCGVEVLGKEYCFVAGASSCTGVLQTRPRSHSTHIFRDAVPMGISPLSRNGIKRVIRKFKEVWPANAYHLTDCNCISFAEELLCELGVSVPFPKWVQGAASTAGKIPSLKALADRHQQLLWEKGMQP